MRKKRSKTSGQHTICAKIDAENWEWLQGVPNKNRVINQGLWWWLHMFRRSAIRDPEEAMSHWEDCIIEERENEGLGD